MEANGATSASAGFAHIVFRQHVVEGGSADAEKLGSFYFVAAYGFEDIADVFALHLLQADEGRGRRAGWRYGIEAEVFGGEHTAFAHHAAMRDGGCQLADVARPAVFGTYV